MSDQTIEVTVRGSLDDWQADAALDIVRSAVIDALGELRDESISCQVKLVDVHGNTEHWDL